MTAARQGARSGWVALLACIMMAAAGPGRSDPLVVNPDTGLAISGFDPVAYFTDHKPSAGRSDIELTDQGAVWRFRNPGNRNVFAAHPDIYRPRFGGYDPIAIAAGRSVPGHPLFWAVVAERLYLFYGAENRQAFLADPGRAILAANRAWPALEQTIAR
jgi:hypothetical protein